MRKENIQQPVPAFTRAGRSRFSRENVTETINLSAQYNHITPLG